MTHRDVEQLKLDYPDTAWQARYARICDLVEILADCIIPDGYVISDTLNEAIVLTAAGAAMRDKLVRKENVPAKEAKLMCALTIGHLELYVDVEKIDVSKLASAIDGELRKRRIRFPFIFGRELYDRYAELHDGEKDSLPVDDALKLIDPLPPGVFQYGFYTIGPYGLQEAPGSRSLQSTKQVPAYHCARSACRAIHPVLLETSHAAPINHEREKLDALLRQTNEDSAEWWPFAAVASGYSAAQYGDQKSATVIPLIGDALALDELRSLVADLFDSTSGSLRRAVQGFLEVKSSTETVAALGRAELLQVALFAHEREIALSLDRLVRSGKIAVPRGEVRRAVTSRRMASGAFRLRAELGSLGVRYAAEDPGFALLRERRVLDQLYVRDTHTDVEELEWQLRGVDVEDIDERLDHFFQTTDPRKVLERMVLARKTNMIAACEEVGMEDFESLSDDVLIDTLLWKLGFHVGTEIDPHYEFWSRHEKLWALTQSSDIGASGRFRDSASPYFSQLEGLLLESLAFTAWALMTDHMSAETPFSYDDEDDRKAGLALMESIAPSPRGSASYTSDHVDLGNLIGGFSALGNHLERALSDRPLHERPPSEFPDYDGQTAIKQFLLRSTMPFLDLTPPSRERVVAGLREITQVMAHAEVNAVRNDYSHYRRNTPDISKMEAALEATRQAVTRIETLGFCRLLFTPKHVSRDGWGRSLHEFVGPRSYEHAFTRPTRFDWMGLPGLTEPSFLMRAASVGEPTEVLRFSPRYRSAFSEMWQGYPARRTRPRSATSDQPDVHETRLDAHSQ
jgi:hypothetical protein